MSDLQAQIQSQEAQAAQLEKFIQTVKDRGLAITELDSRLVHELIERIEVYAPDKSSGRRTQRIHIRYAGLGFIPAQTLTQAKE